MKTAFLGIGLMGLPMSKRLLRAGIDLTVWNRTPEKCEPLASEGAHIAASAEDAVRQADLIFLCLSDSDAVQAVWETIMPFVRSGSTVVDLSSIDPQITKALSQSAALHQCCWLDCPVSGGVSGAESGTLTMMAGGDPDVLVQIKPVLDRLSARVTHMGASGSGQYAKICNQMIVGCNALIIAEVVAFAERQGVDATKLTGAFAGGFADSKPFRILAPQMAERRFTPVRWRVNTLLKDLKMAVDHAERSAADTPITRLAHKLMHAHSEQGFGVQDPATLIKGYIDDKS